MKIPGIDLSPTDRTSIGAGVPEGLRAHALDDASPLPLVIEPNQPVAADVVAAMLAANRNWVEEQLLAHGALLFRDVGVRDPRGFEAVARAVTTELRNGYLGTSPRDALTDYVFNASELPGFYPIPQHCEMSFVKKPTSRLLFACLVAPTSEGGETPLCDFRSVLRDLDPAVRARFETRGVRILRNYSGPEGGRAVGPWQLKPWHHLFGTTDRARVEHICRENEFEYTWLPGGRLRLIHTQPAVRPHPVTGELVWFNHSQVFHLSQAYGELRRIALRQHSVRIGALGAVAWLLSHLQAALQSDEELAMQCSYGDGQPIPYADIEAVRDAIWKNLRAFRWRVGDVVLIDNFAISHGRMPYRGPRQIVVAWS